MFSPFKKKQRKIKIGETYEARKLVSYFFDCLDTLIGPPPSLSRLSCIECEGLMAFINWANLEPQKMALESSALVRKLAHNDAVVRSSAFESLCSFLTSKGLANLDLLEWLKIWKGLYYSMWFCDKPIPQQDLAGNFGKLFSKVIPSEQLEVFYQAYWVVLEREWHLIDKWRVDKFLMLVRRVLRHILFRLADEGWPKEKLDSFTSVLMEYPLRDDRRFPQSLTYHMCDIFLDEIEYVIFKDFRTYSEEIDDDSYSEDDYDDNDNEDEDEENEKEKKKSSKGASSLNGQESLEEEIAMKRKEILATTPFVVLVAPFKKLASNTRDKAVKAKIMKEIFDDNRLQEWKVTEKKTDVVPEDEWTGFK